MASHVLAARDLLIEEAEHHEAENILEQTQDVDRLQFLIDLEDGRQLPLPPSTSALLEAVLHVAAKGGRVTFSTLPSEMTTAAAAAWLGISRPTLMKLIREKKIPSHKAGSHTRIKTDDLKSFRESRNLNQKKTFAELRKMSGILD